MVLPITGPIVTSEYNGTKRYLYRERYRQKRPYDRPLPYYRLWRRSLSVGWPQSGWDDVNTANVTYGAFRSKCFNDNEGPASIAMAQAKNRARAKFNDGLGDAAQLALLYLERKKSMATLRDSFARLNKFSVLLQMRKFKAAGLVLTDGDPLARKQFLHSFGKSRRLSKELSFKRGAKAFANNFLAYRFFWAATANDIFTAVDVLQKDVPPIRHKGYGRVSGQYYALEKQPSSCPSPTDSVQCTISYDERCSCGADIKVTNPNLWLANQLGLVNPALWLYEATPWSFVVNYFFYVEEFLSQFTEHWGLTVSNPWYTTKHYSINNWVQRVTNCYPVVHYAWHGSNDVYQTRRFVGSLPDIRLTTRSSWRLSKVRALTLASLLVQKLK